MRANRLTTSSGVISVGGFNNGFSSITFSSGILPLPKTIPGLASASTGTASAYQSQSHTIVDA